MPSDDTRALREDERAALDRLHPDVFTRSRREIAEAAFIAGLRYRDEAEPSEAEVEAVVAVIKKDCCSYSDGDGSLGYGLADREYARVARAVLIAARKASP